MSPTGPRSASIDGKIREAFEEAGVGIETEIDLLARAHKMGMATFAFVLNESDMRRFAPAGVDAYIINAGLTPLQFAVGDRRDRLQDSITHIKRMLAVVEGAAHRPLCLVLWRAVH